MRTDGRGWDKIRPVAIGAPFSRQTVEGILGLAEKGTGQLVALQRQVLLTAVEAKG
jgi:ribonuclease PH